MYDVACGARWASAGFDHEPGGQCGREVTERIGDTWVCLHHYQRAWRMTVAPWKRDFLATVEQEVARRLAEVAEIRETARREKSVVYYVRRADGLIKIGTTRKFARRMSDLRKEHGELQLLLTHPGSREREAEMHRKFAQLCVTGEWFRNTKRLALWIQKCRGDPSIASTQPPGTVDMHAIRLLLRDGIRASLAASADYRAARKADYEDPDDMVRRLMREGKWPPSKLSAA